MGVDVEHLAQAVLVVLPLTALDLVVGLLGTGLIGFNGRGERPTVLVHAVGDAPVVLPLGDLVNLRHALGGVKVGRRERQDHTVDGQELDDRPLLLLVVPQLQVLRAAKRQLGQHLLLLVAELFDLLGDLPVQKVPLALRALGLQLIDLAQNLGAHGAIRREQLLDGTGRKVHAPLGHDRVYGTAGTHKVGTAGGVLAHAGAPNALLVLLVPVFPGGLVLLQQLDVPHSQRVQIVAVHRLGHVGVEVWGFLGATGL